MIFSENDWIIFDIQANIKKLSKGIFQNKLLGKKPITGISNGDKFCVINTSPNGNNYLLQVFDSRTGIILNEQEQTS